MYNLDYKFVKGAAIVRIPAVVFLYPSMKKCKAFIYSEWLYDRMKENYLYIGNP